MKRGLLNWSAFTSYYRKHLALLSKEVGETGMCLRQTTANVSNVVKCEPPGNLTIRNAVRRLFSVSRLIQGSAQQSRTFCLDCVSNGFLVLHMWCKSKTLDQVPPREPTAVHVTTYRDIPFRISLKRSKQENMQPAALELSSKPCK